MNEKSGEKKDAAPRPRGRLPYEHRLAYYVPPLGRSERALKWLIARGRKRTPPDLPPFDDLPRMRDWWSRCMKQRVPDDLVALATGALASPSPASPPAAAPGGALGPLFANAPATIVAQPSSSTGYSAALRRAREAEAAAGMLYNTLLEKANAPECTNDERIRLSSESEQVRRAWEKTADQLRAYEKDAVAILAASGGAWDSADVIAANDLIHAVLRDSMRGLLLRVRPKLAGRTDAEQDTLWQTEVERMFALLRDNKFTAPAAPHTDGGAST